MLIIRWISEEGLIPIPDLRYDDIRKTKYRLFIPGHPENEKPFCLRRNAL